RGAQSGDTAADDQKLGRTHPNAILTPLPIDDSGTRIDVKTPSRAYPVTIHGGAIERTAALLDGAGAPGRRFVVSSPLVWRLHGPQLARALGVTEPVLVPDGERFKQLGTV